ncbi:MAG: FG-GAP-like repeat-containing protein [Polyangiales bacterium]
MVRWSRLGLILSLVSFGVGCSDDPPASTDAGTDAGDVTDVTDTGDTGDAGDGGVCPVVTFTRPAADAVLGVNDDADRNCGNGFTYDVEVATNAPAGAMIELSVNGRVVGTQTVASPAVRFAGVQLDSGAASAIEARVVGAAGCSPTSVSVTANCNLPRCQITAPTGSTLNASDSTAGAGMPFATTFTVGTDIEDGQSVDLIIGGATAPLRATAMGGTARFTNVGLSPDGMYRLRASCTNRAGNTGLSAEVAFTVDATLPTLEVTRPMGGVTIGLSTDVNTTLAGLQFNVCARSDAAGRQVCSQVMGGRPDDPGGCAAVPASAATEVCTEVTCPDGSAPFDVEMSVSDAAGNTQRVTVAGVRCQSALPSVRIVAPRAFDAMDPTSALNASADADPMTAGFQAEVVACTDRAAGMAQLFLGEVMTPTATATVAPVAPGDPCATLGMGFTGIVRFPNVTLPQSFPARTTSTSPAPTNPSLRVAVTDATGDEGRSAPSVLWVDSAPPSLNIFDCNRLVRPAAGDTGAAVDIAVSSDSYPVTLTLERMGEMPRTLTLAAPTAPGGTGRWLGQRFEAGVTNLRLSATDLAGNTSTTSGMCSISVGNPPTVRFVSPTAGQTFTSNPTTDVVVETDAPVGTTVTLTVAGGAPVTGTVATGGQVRFSGVTLPESDAVSLVATTADVAGRGVGTSSIAVVVDTQAPTAPTGLSAAVPTTPASARRAGTVRLTFTHGSDSAPAGGTRAVDGYELRFANVPLTTSNYNIGTRLTAVIPTGAPGAMAQVDVPGLLLEENLYFGLRARDAAGNVSGDIAFTGPFRIPVNVQEVSNATPPLGNSVSGGNDVNGDGFADIIVGSGSYSAGNAGLARIYFGSATGISATNFTEIRGAVSDGRFGTSVASLGDVNGDGVGDIAIGEPGPPTTSALRPGAVYIYFGRSTWRTGASAPYQSSEANVTIANGTGDFATARLGLVVARVGDFDGDGLNDVAASIPNAPNGGGALLFRGRTTWPATLTPGDANLTIRNDGTSSFLGFHLAGAGRLLGNDTRDDLIIGGGLSSTPGFTLVYAGRALSAPLTLSVTDATFNRPGVAPGSVMGSTVANAQYIASAVGDIDGDGRPDLAIGNAGTPPSGITAGGEVALYFGTGAGGLEGPVRVSGPGPNQDLFGRYIAGISDATQLHPQFLNPRGTYADLLVASAAFENGAPRFYLFRGRERSTWPLWTTRNAPRSIDARGNNTNSINAAAWVGDVNGDGYPDAAFAQFSGDGTLYIVQ